MSYRRLAAKLGVCEEVQAVFKPSSFAGFASRVSQGIILASLVMSTSLGAKSAPSYLNPAIPLDKRVSDLLARLTLEEKAKLLNVRTAGAPRLGIAGWGGWNQGIHGVWSLRPTTLFPAPIAMGATWDPELVRKIAGAIGDEGRALYNIGATGPADGAGGTIRHGLIYRSPVVNISRDPRWGRVHEAYSEDPLLTAEMGIAFVRGLQGDDPRQMKVAATVKHYAVNNVEFNRMRLSATVDQRSLHDFWLPHWRRIVTEAKPASVMTSYNAIDGVPMAANDELVNGTLRRRWGFQGFVTADGGGVSLLSDQYKGQSLTDDPVAAAAMALKAGTDTANVDYEQELPKAVQRNLITEKEIDRALGRVLSVGFRLGVFDPAETDRYRDLGPKDIRSAAHLQLTEQAAAEALTLLRNERSFLPLDVTKLQSIAVIGPACDDSFEVGGYYDKNAFRIGVNSALTRMLSPRVRVAYERGAGIVEPIEHGALARAVALARSSDVAVVCLGTDHRVESEGIDRRDLGLPGDQQRLLQAVYAANPKVALVLFSGGPLGVTWAANHVPAILNAYYPGEAGGPAIARALIGEDNPSGRLPFTMYADLNGLPPPNEYDASKGFTYQYFKGIPLYPFGHGLSYSKFQYSKLRQTAFDQQSGTVQLSFDLTNDSDRLGAEIVQVYTRPAEPSAFDPLKKLAAFRRVVLKPRETLKVTMTIPTTMMATFDEAVGKGVVRSGRRLLMIGSSSEDIRLKGEFEVARDIAMPD